METNIGLKIKELREGTNLSITELAMNTSTPLGIFEAIEKGEHIPSLSLLSKIAKILGVRLGTILDGNETLTPVITKKESANNDEQQPVSLPLACLKADRYMDPYIVHVDYSKPDTKKELKMQEGEEFIYVLNGNIVFYYGNKEYQLSTGDSIYYDSIVPHHMSAPTAEQHAKILAINYSPIV